MSESTLSLLATIAGVIVGCIGAYFTYLQLPKKPKQAPENLPAEEEKTRNEQKLQIAKDAINDKRLIPFLKWLYAKEPILQKGAYTYPVAIYPASKEQWTKLDSALKHPLIRDEPSQDTYLVKNDEFLKLVQSLKENGLGLKNDTNYYNYALHKLIVDRQVQIECNLGRYYSSYISSEALEWEIRTNLHKLDGSDVTSNKQFLSSLELRSKLHQHVANPVRDGTGRSAAVGISTLIAYNDAGTLKLLTRKRSRKGVPLRAGMLHVLPGFMFQPVTNDYEQEYNVTHHIYREYLEELFSMSEEQDKKRHANYFYSDKRLKYLRSLIDTGDAKLYFTGICMNLLNLRPEICTLLVITTPEWYVKCQTDKELGWKFNYELADLDDGVAPAKEFIGGLTLGEDLKMIETASIYPERTVPAGAGAFWLGVDVLRTLQIKLEA